MANNSQAAVAEFRRIMKWIAAAAVLMVVGALAYLRLFGPLELVTTLATTFGVFLSVLVGCGLFAAAFFSNKSGLDQQVTDMTLSERRRADAKTHNRRKSS